MSDERTFTAQQLRTAQRPTLETPEQHPSQLLQDQRIARKRRRVEESPDQRERRLERQREYQRNYRQRRKIAATTEQTLGDTATEERAVKLQKKRVRARVARSVESAEQRDTRLLNMRVNERENRSVESAEQRDTRLLNMRVNERENRSVERYC